MTSAAKKYGLERPYALVMADSILEDARVVTDVPTSAYLYYSQQRLKLLLYPLSNPPHLSVHFACNGA